MFLCLCVHRRSLGFHLDGLEGIVGTVTVRLLEYLSLPRSQQEADTGPSGCARVVVEEQSWTGRAVSADCQAMSNRDVHLTC
jgi:hypothetical protein